MYFRGKITIMKKVLIILSLIFVLSCQSVDEQYIITSNAVGFISQNTKVSQLKDLYPNDSIHTLNLDNQLATINKKYVLYSNKGDKMLVLEPNGTADTSKIAQVEVISPKFKTQKGLNTKSTYKEVYNNYEISSIQRTLVNVIINLKKEGVFLAIDNEHLPDDLEYDEDAVIKPTQIPDDAPIKYFWVNLN